MKNWYNTSKYVACWWKTRFSHLQLQVSKILERGEGAPTHTAAATFSALLERPVLACVPAPGVTTITAAGAKTDRANRWALQNEMKLQ